MGNSLPGVKVDPETSVQSGGANSSINSNQLSDSVSTNITITTSTIFLILLFLLALTIILFWFLHKANLEVLNKRINNLAHLAGFGSAHLKPTELKSLGISESFAKSLP